MLLCSTMSFPTSSYNLHQVPGYLKKLCRIESRCEPLLVFYIAGICEFIIPPRSYSLNKSGILCFSFQISIKLSVFSNFSKKTESANIYATCSSTMRSLVPLFTVGLAVSGVSGSSWFPGSKTGTIIFLMNLRGLLHFQHGTLAHRIER